MFIVEDGSGVVGANSYLSVADADAYFVNHGSPAAWVDAAASTSLTLGTLPLDGETITIGATVYTYKTTVTPTDGEIPIGADVAASLKNTKDVINGDVVRNPDIPPTTTPHPDVAAALSGTAAVLVTAKVGGTAGNSILVTETFLSALNIFSSDFLIGGEDSKEQALIFGTQYLDSTYVPRYIGSRFSNEQGLHWPRAGVVLNDGRSLGTNELPIELLNATAEMALKGVDGTDIFDSDSDNNGVIAETEVRVASLLERIRYVGGFEPIKRYRKVTDLLWNILRPAGEVRRG